jgi:hypothetical protein
VKRDLKKSKEKSIASPIMENSQEFSDFSESVDISEDEKKRDLKEQEGPDDESSEVEFVMEKPKPKNLKGFDPRLHRMASKMT